jgi:hypothetical protein
LDNLRKISKPLGAPVSRPVRTMDRPRSDHTDHSRPRPPPTCHAHGFLPPFLRPRFHRRAALRPPPLPTIKGAHPPPWSTLSSSSAFRPPLHRHSRHRRATADSLLRPLSDRFDHAPSTAPPCTTSPYPETSTTTPDTTPTVVPLWPTTPRRRARSSGELFLPAAPKRVHHPTALLPGPSPLHLIAGRRRNSVGPLPAPP